GGTIPARLTEQVSPLHRCMIGTNQKNPRCIALAGTPGKEASCTIYENRSSTCREFAMSGENGIENEACNRARCRYGLPPI
ncbi:TPA: YkgJ family cysteine cluster protein, partial [Escherichia coli]